MSRWRSWNAYWNFTCSVICISGNVEELNFFEWLDVETGERITVQADNICGPSYIDSAWLGKAYKKYIADEAMEECMENCEDNEGAV